MGIKSEGGGAPGDHGGIMEGVLALLLWHMRSLFCTCFLTCKFRVKVPLS